MYTYIYICIYIYIHTIIIDTYYIMILARSTYYYLVVIHIITYSFYLLPDAHKYEDVRACRYNSFLFKCILYSFLLTNCWVMIKINYYASCIHSRILI